jgi:signal peptidase I
MARSKRTWLWVAGRVVLGLAFLLPLLVFEFHKVPSTTMLPNIRPGEHVVSNRWDPAVYLT